jgi:uncharacterized RDD family membrane protein YckC
MNGLGLNVKQKKIVVEAQLWKRALAFILDIFILDLFVLFPFAALLEKILKATTYTEIFQAMNSSPDNLSKIIALTIAISIMTALYFAIFERIFGQSIGKMVMNIFVINAESEYGLKVMPQKITFWQSLVRSIGILFLANMIFITIADIIYMFFTPYNQRLFEKLSKTRTVTVTFI